MQNAHTIQTNQSSLRSRSLQLLLALCLAFAALAPTVARATAPSSGVPFAQALKDARKVASTHDGWKVFQAQGQSMEPQFGGTSLLVAAGTKFEGLQPGMLVVYRDMTGDLVAHRLVQLTAAGWVVQGLNNERSDPGLVTESNLQGVVFGIFNFKPGTENVAAIAATDQPPVAYAKRY